MTSPYFRPESGVSEDYQETKIFALIWALSLSLMTILLAGTILAPLFKHLGFNGLSEFLYGFYHLSCHQLPSRCFFILGEKMGVCSRCFATHLFFVCAGAMLYAVPVREWLGRRSFLRMVLPWFFILSSPLLADGLVQLTTSWESTNILRFVTGGLMGVGLALLLGFLVLRFSRRMEQSLR